MAIRLQKAKKLASRHAECAAGGSVAAVCCLQCIDHRRDDDRIARVLGVHCKRALTADLRQQLGWQLGGVEVERGTAIKGDSFAQTLHGAGKVLRMRSRLFGMADQARRPVVQSHRSLDAIASLATRTAGPVAFFAALLEQACIIEAQPFVAPAVRTIPYSRKLLRRVRRLPVQPRRTRTVA